MEGSLSLGTLLKRKGAQFSFNAVEDGAQPEVQRIRFTSLGPPGGHWRLRHDGVSTTPIKVDASADEVRSALEAALFSSIEVSKTLISSGHQFLVTFVADPGDISDLDLRRVREYGPRPRQSDAPVALLPGRRIRESHVRREWRRVPVAVWGQAHGTAVIHGFIPPGPASPGEAPYHW